jgi:hypothetical protein
LTSSFNLSQFSWLEFGFYLSLSHSEVPLPPPTLKLEAVDFVSISTITDGFFLEGCHFCVKV